ncbi:serine carboxypeptidase-like 17 [Artemisia annua]|uniref:Serine carboxypeptidase-like 17 n=1 Tax=Artemisia annua TaxID=35608 RepID=A0A2U1LFV2_ARTAN|nr:serine carboxypeptidase-like 17 [Artemisia annua]
MEWFSKTLMLLMMILALQFSLNHSKSIVNTLPGFSGQLPFVFETGYVGIGEREESSFSIISLNHKEIRTMIRLYSISLVVRVVQLYLYSSIK